MPENFHQEFIGKAGAGKSPYPKPFLPLLFDDVSFLVGADIPKPKFWQKLQNLFSKFIDFWKCKRNPDNFRNKNNRKCILFHLHYNKSIERHLMAQSFPLELFKTKDVRSCN